MLEPKRAPEAAMAQQSVITEVNSGNAENINPDQGQHYATSAVKPRNERQQRQQVIASNRREIAPIDSSTCHAERVRQYFGLEEFRSCARGAFRNQILNLQPMNCLYHLLGLFARQPVRSEALLYCSRNSGLAWSFDMVCLDASGWSAPRLASPDATCSAALFSLCSSLHVPMPSNLINHPHHSARSTG